MKIRIQFINFIVFTLFAFSPPVEETITWKEGQLLQWSDFKGKTHDPNSVASTTCDIDKKITNYTDSAIVTIEAVFLPNRSWRRKSRNDSDLLMHEQKHFDITELYARKLRREIANETFADYDDLSLQVSHKHKKIMDELNQYQDKYDLKTDHSMNGSKQRKWNKKVSAELNKLDHYKNTRLVIHLKKSIVPDTASK